MKTSFVPADFAGEAQEIINKKIYDACMTMFAKCITNKCDLRIILEVKDCSVSGYDLDRADYYMIDFSSCGTPFDDGTRVCVSHSLTEYMKDYDYYRDAMDWLMDQLTKNFEMVYVESF